jgi:uncharacterized protein
MSEVFADTNFWVALTNPNDRWHSAAHAAARELAPRHLVTTEDVLTEFLAFLAEQGPQFRQVATLTLRSILLDVEVVIQTHDSFLAALAYCESRPDKGYSLTDCGSMTCMHARGLTDVLTNDERFRQEGFRTLL